MLILLVIAPFRADIYIMLVVGITEHARGAPLLRAKIAVLKRKSYIEAALALGFPPGRDRHNTCSGFHGRACLVIQATIGMGEAILIETGLSYLGFGVQEPVPSWGNMVAPGKELLSSRATFWISTAPALAILFTILGFHLMGDG